MSRAFRLRTSVVIVGAAFLGGSHSSRAAEEPKGSSSPVAGRVQVSKSTAPRVVQPGTSEAARGAALEAKVRAGILPVNQLGGILDPESVVLPEPPYRGTVVLPRSNANADASRFEQWFVGTFPRQDPVPASRVAHFSWIPKYDHVRQLGWNARIVGVSRQPDGSVLVQVRVAPNLYSARIKTTLGDYVLETYRVNAGRIELIATDAAVPKPEAQVFPIH